MPSWRIILLTLIHCAANSMNEKDEILEHPLYHGTSSIFLDGIIQHGLGGLNPIAEWKIPDVAKEIYPLVQEHFANSGQAMLKVDLFSRMVKQFSGAWNFQHGDTYLSPSYQAAVRYATNQRYGSELLTCTLFFLDELLRLNVQGVSEDLFGRYPDVFNKLNVSPAPILIKLREVPTRYLLSEAGSDATPALQQMKTTAKDTPELFELLHQQDSFRLRFPIQISKLELYFINVTRWDPVCPRYFLYPLG